MKYQGFNDVTAYVPTSPHTHPIPTFTLPLVHIRPQNFGAYYQLWTNGVPTVNTGADGLAKFDYVVSSAKAHGIRLIVALTNNWSDYGGMDVYVSQLNPGGTHDTFYTNPKIIAAYQNYINVRPTIFPVLRLHRSIHHNNLLLISLPTSLA